MRVDLKVQAPIEDNGEGSGSFPLRVGGMRHSAEEDEKDTGQQMTETR